MDPQVSKGSKDSVRVASCPQSFSCHVLCCMMSLPLRPRLLVHPFSQAKCRNALLHLVCVPTLFFLCHYLSEHYLWFTFRVVNWEIKLPFLMLWMLSQVWTDWVLPVKKVRFLSIHSHWRIFFLFLFTDYLCSHVSSLFLSLVHFSWMITTTARNLWAILPGPSTRPMPRIKDISQ